MTLKTTPLHDAHLALKARMVDFGGWDMPVNYGSQIEEHHAVRRDCGMFDVSHMCVVELEGDDCRAFLRTLIANDVDKLKTAGRALYSCMLNADGGVIDDLIIYYFREDRFRLVVNAGTADGDVQWMRDVAARHTFLIKLVPRRGGVGALALIAVQGPKARALAPQAVPAIAAACETLKPFNAQIVANTPFGETMVARTGYTGEDGLELAVPAEHGVALWNALLAAGAKPCGLGARDTLRLEAGMNLYGHDMDIHTSPLDAGLAWTVELHSGREFIGRKPLVAAGQRHQFLGLILLDKGGVPREHQTVLTTHGEGAITSGSFAPTMAQSIAFARLPLDVAPGDVVEVQIRDKRLRAQVVKLPFVRNGKILAA